MEPDVHFCTFGSLPNYARALRTLCREAGESGYFASVTAYTQHNLPASRKELDFMSRNPKGYGFWIWKSILLEDMLEKIPAGDIVLRERRTVACALLPHFQGTPSRPVHLQHPFQEIRFGQQARPLMRS